MTVHDHPSRGGALRLLDAVQNVHDCPGLADCPEHPSWHVWRDVHVWPGPPEWVATSPDEGCVGFPTHAEAVAYATEQARADQLKAIQGQNTEVPC